MTCTLRALTCSLALPLACILLGGCHISEHKNGGNDKVDIGTPFGSMHVKTNEAADTAAIGLSTYPGAVPAKEDNGKDKDAADINLNFGNFHLGVRAASFQTADQTDKVLAFYRKDLSRYGDVIQCRGSKVIGSPSRTSQGLTCDEQKHTHISGGDSDGNNLELRAGSPQHQHIVGVETKSGGTKIGLVLLDLPSHLSDHDSSDSE